MEKKNVIIGLLLLVVVCCVSCQNTDPVFDYATFEFLDTYPQTVDGIKELYSNLSFNERKLEPDNREKLGKFYYVTLENDEITFMFRGYSLETVVLASVEISYKKYEPQGIILIGKDFLKLKNLVPEKKIYNVNADRFYIRSKDYEQSLRVISDSGIITSYKIEREL